MRLDWFHSWHWWAVHLRWWWSDGKLLLRRSVEEFGEDRCTQMAASISYYVLFSVFPLAILVVAIAGLVLQNDALRADVVDGLLDVVPLSEDEGREDVEDLVSGVATGLSALGLLSVIGLAWSASGMMGAIRRALNEAWDTDYRRPFLRGKLIDLAMMLGVGALVSLSLATTIFLQVARRVSGDVSDALGPLGDGATLGFEVAAVLVPLSLSFAVFLVLYKVVPAVRTRFRHIWPGALVAAVLFEIVKNGFAFYLSNFGNYDAIYGSLGAVIAFLFFIYISANILLFGAEFASEWPRVIHGHYDARSQQGPGGPARQRLGAALKRLVVHEEEMPHEVDAEAGRDRRERKEEEIARRRAAEAPPEQPPAPPQQPPADGDGPQA